MIIDLALAAIFQDNVHRAKANEELRLACSRIRVVVLSSGQIEDFDSTPSQRGCVESSGDFPLLSQSDSLLD
jgi:hypothetical protein